MKFEARDINQISREKKLDKESDETRLSTPLQFVKDAINSLKRKSKKKKNKNTNDKEEEEGKPSVLPIETGNPLPAVPTDENGSCGDLQEDVETATASTSITTPITTDEKSLTIHPIENLLLDEEWSNEEILKYLIHHRPFYNSSGFLEYIYLPSEKYPFIVSDALDWYNKALGHENLDKEPFKPKKLTGWLHNCASEHMVQFLHTEDSREFALESFRQKFLCWRTIARLIDWGMGQEEEKMRLVKDLLVKYSLEKIKNLKDKNDYMIFPGYWIQRYQTDISSAHGVGYKFEYQEDGVWSFSIYNTGWGSQHHYGYTPQRGSKRKQNSRYLVLNVSFDGAAEIVEQLHKWSLGLEQLKEGPSRFYKWVQGYGVSCDEVRVYEDLITEQYSGTCTWRCIKAVLRDHQRSRDAYKRVSFRLKIRNIINYARYLSPDDGEFDKYRQLLMQAYQRCVKAATKLDAICPKWEQQHKEMLDMALEAIQRLQKHHDAGQEPKPFNSS